MVSPTSSPRGQESQRFYTQPTENNKVKSIADHCFTQQKPQSSRVFQALVITALAAVAAALVICLVASPVGWIATTLSVSTLAAKVILGAALATTFIGLNVLAYALASKKNRQKVEFELSAMRRLASEWLLRGKNHDEISLEGLSGPDGAELPAGAALFLGALPNKLQFDKTLLGTNGAVYSINEPFELNNLGLSKPFTAQDWAQSGIAYSGIISEDHELLSPEQMDHAAEQIHEWISEGKKVYVHCRAGHGRSATAVAAYLMKYGQNLSLEEICVRIKKQRGKATIFNKIQALVEYDRFLKTDNRPSSSEDFNKLVGRLQDPQKSKKAPKPWVKEIMAAARCPF